MANEKIRLGSIYACIAGDHRYGSEITVYAVGDKALIERTSTCPVGGMDGPGGVHEPELKECIACELEAHRVVRAINRLIAYERPQIIARHGKPTKNFTWAFSGVPAGLSLAKCAQAIELHNTP